MVYQARVPLCFAKCKGFRGLGRYFAEGVKVSEDSGRTSRNAWRFPRIREGLRRAHGGFRELGKAFRGMRSHFRGFGKHFAERVAISEGSESILRSAQLFPRARKAFFPFKSYFRIVDEQKTRIFRDPIYGLLIV